MQTPMLRIRLFGALELRIDEQLLPAMTSARAEGLLAYLLLHRRASLPRQQLAFTLWPDSSEAQARTNLRHVLHDLRRALPDADRFLEITERTLRWRDDAPYWLDVATFETALSRAQRAGEDDGLAALREAVELYGGDLLEGRYDEWLVAERERLRSRYLETLERLATQLEARGDHVQAIDYAERLLQRDPLNEVAYRLLMRLHAGRGQPARALQVYHLCSSTLEEELGIEPSAETRALYEALFIAGPEGMGGPSRSQPQRAGGTTLVGRASEWQRLTALWQESERGRAQMVLITGEPGVGKSRLVAELQTWVTRRGAATATARAYAAEGAVALDPLVTWLRSPDLASRLERLDRVHLAPLAPLLPDLLPSSPAALELVPDSEQRRRLFESATRAILAGSPILLVADDLHWFDRATLQFLHVLLRMAPEAPLLVLATARREEIDPHHPLTALIGGLLNLERFTEFELGRLDRHDVAHIAVEVAGAPLTETAAQRLFQETEGNPLFVVETLRAGWTAEGPSAAINPRVQAVIESRLARLSDTARNLIGFAAAIGREFSPAVLAVASQSGDEPLMWGLDELWRHRLVREQGSQGYDFSHDKIREVAYQTLSPARRRHHHLAIATALQHVHAHDLDAVSSQIASHCEQAGQVDEAIAWYQRAAEAAQKLYAGAQVIDLLDRALDLLSAQPETDGRRNRELAVLAMLPAVIGWVEGFASPRLAEIHRRALSLSGALGVELAPPLLRSLALAALSRSDFRTANESGEQLRRRGQRTTDDVLLVEADYVLGIAAFWEGRFETARRHFDAAVDRYQPEYRRAHLLQYGLDPKVICLSRLANTLWFLGETDAATRARDAALELGDEVGHPLSRSTALVFAALLALEMGEIDRMRVAAEKLVADRRNEAKKPTQVAAEAIVGYLETVDGRVRTGLTRMRRVLDETREAEHAPGIHASVLRLLMAACVITQDAAAGLAAADEVMALQATRLWESEARRLRAESLLSLGSPPDAVKTELDLALQVARRQGARALERRVLTSLLRYHQRFGDQLEVRQARDALHSLRAESHERHES